MDVEAVNDPSSVSFVPNRLPCSRSFDGMQISIISACLPNPSLSCGSPIYSITIQEGYYRAFVDADANNDGNLSNDRVSGGFFFSAFEVNPSGGAPVASTPCALGAPANSTRFLIRLESIPASVSGISWPSLVPSTNAPLNSALCYVTSTFSGSAGVATATYEYQSVNQTEVSDVTLESFSLSPGIVLKSGGTGAGTIKAGV